MENKKFVEVKVSFKLTNLQELEDINSQAMAIFECDGVQEFSIDEPTVDEILGERAYSGGDIPSSVIDEVNDVARLHHLNLVYFFYQSENSMELANKFSEFVKDSKLADDISVEEKPWDDWNKEWRKFYSLIEVDDNLTVVPEWEKENFNKPEEDCIYIYPGMGFGTGEHQTTYLCLKLLMNVLSEIPKGGTCLDFGCGSGILGIAAIKKLSSEVVFCDIDPEALHNCLQNIELNFKGKNLTGTSLVSRERFNSSVEHDLVFANILENVLLQEKLELVKSVRKGGALIVSGLLNQQVDTIIKEYKEFEMVSTISKDDWSAILFKKL